MYLFDRNRRNSTVRKVNSTSLQSKTGREDKDERNMSGAKNTKEAKAERMLLSRTSPFPNVASLHQHTSVPSNANKANSSFLATPVSTKDACVPTMTEQNRRERMMARGVPKKRWRLVSSRVTNNSQPDGAVGLVCQSSASPTQHVLRTFPKENQRRSAREQVSKTTNSNQASNNENT